MKQSVYEISQLRTSKLNKTSFLFMLPVFPLLYLCWSTASCLMPGHASPHLCIPACLHPCIHPLSSSYWISSVCQNLGCVDIPSTSLKVQLKCPLFRVANTFLIPYPLSHKVRAALPLLSPIALHDICFRAWCSVLLGVFPTGVCASAVSRGELGCAPRYIFLLQDA